MYSLLNHVPFNIQMLNGEIKTICEDCVQLRQHPWHSSETKGNMQRVSAEKSLRKPAVQQDE